MVVLEAILVLLFAAFFVGTVLRVLAMLERKKAGQDIERARLVFFFLGCLMLICLIPLQLFGFLTLATTIADLTVVAANFIGYALTYNLGRRRRSRRDGELPKPTTRVYQLYYRGQPFGLISKDSMDILLAHKLIKRQRTPELVEGFQTEAQKLGVGVTLLRNRDGSQTLVRVTGPTGVASGAADEAGR